MITRGCNRLPVAKNALQQLLNIWIQILDCLIDYTILVIDYQQLINVLNSNFKSCNRLHKSYNRLPEKIFRKIFLRVTTSQMVFTWPPTSVYSLKEQNHFILLRIPWPIHLQFIKESSECSDCKIYLFQERFILLFFLIL